MTMELIQKCQSAYSLIFQAKEELRRVALNLGMEFAIARRQQIDNICSELLSNIEQNDECAMETSYTNLQDALYELSQEISYLEAEEYTYPEVSSYYAQDDDDDLSGSSMVLKPRRPDHGPGNLDSAVLPPVDD
jgi:hypothetical protein